MNVVHFEIKHHGPQLKRIIDDQHARLVGAQRKLQKVEDKQSNLEERIDRATRLHNFLEQRLQRLRSLPGVHKKPLSRAEREFKSELEHFSGVELDALHSSIDALAARLRRHTQSPKGNLSNQQRQLSGKKILPMMPISPS
ncbi:nuclear pore complex protein nup88 [Quercus suber]|uniref:Nuclear pore complex protein nup88 n=1 Tax=Quercus suber TaxID=58331 RepID=A0AAW0MA76_QUESU